MSNIDVLWTKVQKVHKSRFIMHYLKTIPLPVGMVNIATQFCNKSEKKTKRNDGFRMSLTSNKPVGW